MNVRLWGLLAILLSAQFAFAEDRFTLSVANTIDIFLRDSTTGNGKTGVTVTGITCKLTKHSATATSANTAFTCAASGSSNDCTERAGGIYNVELSAANLDALGTGKLICACSGGLDSKNSFEVVASSSYAVNVNGDISDNDTIAAATKALLDMAYATNWSNIDIPISTIETILGAPVGVSLSADVAAVQAVLPTALVGGKMDSHVNDVASGAITATSIAGDAITAAKVAADVGTELGTALLDLPNGIETGFTMRAWQRLVGATLFGKLSGVDTNNPTFRDVNDTKNRVTSVTNSTGRVSMTLDPN